MDAEIEAKVRQVLESMSQKAKSMGVTGVAAAMVETEPNIWSPIFQVVDRLERPPEPESRGANDTGTNYLAVCWSKMAEMVSTSLDSGSGARPAKTGELGYRGGLVRHGVFGNRYFVAFSGGSPDEDLIIARTGMFTFLS